MKNVDWQLLARLFDGMEKMYTYIKLFCKDCEGCVIGLRWRHATDEIGGGN